jgi:hypothetical protein
MVEIYVKLIRMGLKTIEEVPATIREKVEIALATTN